MDPHRHGVHRQLVAAARLRRSSPRRFPRCSPAAAPTETAADRSHRSMSAQPAVSVPLENAAARPAHHGQRVAQTARHRRRPLLRRGRRASRPCSSVCETHGAARLGVPLRRRRQPRRHLQRRCSRAARTRAVDARRPPPARTWVSAPRCAPASSTRASPIVCTHRQRLHLSAGAAARAGPRSSSDGAEIATASPWHPDSVRRRRAAASASRSAARCRGSTSCSIGQDVHTFTCLFRAYRREVLGAHPLPLRAASPRSRRSCCAGC